MSSKSVELMVDDDDSTQSLSSNAVRKRDRQKALRSEDVVTTQFRLLSTIAEYIVFRQEACFPIRNNSIASGLFDANKRIMSLGRCMKISDIQSMTGHPLASVWIPREAFRTTPIFLGDMKSTHESDVYRTMVRMLIYFASLLFDNDSKHTYIPYFSVSFWYDREITLNKSREELARIAGDMFSNMYSGVMIYVCAKKRDNSGGASSSSAAELDDEDVADIYEMLQTHLDNCSYKENKPKKMTGKGRRGSASTKSNADHDNMVVVDAIQSIGKTTIKQIVNSYLGLISEKTGERQRIYADGCEQWLSSTTCSKLCVASANPSKDDLCIALACNIRKTTSCERDIWNIVMPQVCVPVGNFIHRVGEVLSNSITTDDHEHVFAKRRSSQSSSSSAADSRATKGNADRLSSKSAEKFDEMRDTTVERRLQALSSRLRMQVGEIAGTFGARVKDAIESGVRRLMFTLYCSIARGADSTMSIVGEALHNARIHNGIDSLIPFSLQHYGTALADTDAVHQKLQTSSPYDSFRCSVLYDIITVASFRPENAFLQHFMQETASSAFDDSAKLKPNIIIYGDGGSGKDFILEHLEQVFVENTVIKESRSTEHADATVCHGKRDGQLVYSPELNVAPFLKLKSRGGAGDSNKKDLMTSGKIYTRVFCFDPQTGERTTKLVKHERYVLCYEAMNPSVISKMDEALVQRYLWIGLPPLTMQTNLQILEAVFTQRVKHTTSLDKTKNASYINCQQFMQLTAFEVYKMILCGCIREVSTEGAFFIMFECVAKVLAAKNSVYGCAPPIQRKINQIISIAKGHAIRRAVVENFLTKEGRYYGRPLTPTRLSSLSYFVSLGDIALSLGQAGDYIGIFQDGEVQVIMALRYIWITNKMRYTMFKCDMDTFGEPNPSYVRFPGSLKTLARNCSQVLMLICSVENRAPRLITQDMIYDTLQRLTRSSSASNRLPTVSFEDDCVEFTQSYNAMFRNMSESDDDSPEACSSGGGGGGTTIARPRNHFDYFDSREKRLVVCLATDKKRRSSINKNVLLPPIQAIVRKDDRSVDVHVAYLNRLFDPRKQFWPWTEEKPKRWSPVIDEHTLLMHCLESVRSYRYQCTSPKMIYRMDYREVEEDASAQQSSSSSNEDESSRRSRYDFSFDFVRKHHTTNPQCLRVPFYGDEEEMSTQAPEHSLSSSSSSSSMVQRRSSVLLHAPIDDVSMLSTRIGWAKALLHASSEERWRKMKNSPEFPSRLGRS